MQPDAVSPGAQRDEGRLDSWKEIAAYLRRDVTTVQRWERREGLPVHRLVHARQGSVYAFKHELDVWVQSRAARTDRPQRPTAWWTRIPRMTLVAIPVLLALAFLLKPMLRSGPGTELPSVSEAPAGPIAVATFENQTGDTSLDGFGRLAAERVIRLVAQATQLEVVPSPLESAGAVIAGGAGGRTPSLLVAGAFYRRESSLEFQVKVLDAATGRLLHGVAPVVEPQSRMADAFDRLEQKVAGAIAIHFDDFFGGLQVVAHPPTLDAYREYRAGLEIFQSDYPRSLAHLQRALELDPEFLLPLVIAKFVYSNLGQAEEIERVQVRLESQVDRSTAAERLWIEFLRANQEGRRPQALRVLLDLERAVPRSLLVNFNIVQQALALNRPGLAVDTYHRIPSFTRTLRHSIGTTRAVLIAEAFHLLGAYDRELEEAKRAQEYAPGVHRFFEAEVRALAAQGRVDEVMRVVQKSLAVSPTVGSSGDAGRVMEEAAVDLRAHGHRDASLQVAGRAVEWLERRAPDVRSGRAYRVALASALYLAERWEESRRLYRELLAEYPDDVGFAAHVGQLDARTGEAAGARAISDRLARVPAVGIFRRQARAWATFERARIAALLGEKQAAVDLLRDAITEGFPVDLNIHYNPDLESLRGYAPFADLVRPSDRPER
jgi:tetratricopeptide (TPR) repeat protein